MSSPRNTGSKATPNPPTIVAYGSGSRNRCGSFWNGAGNGSGSAAAGTRNSSGTSTRPYATHRQRRSGSRPSGKYSSRRAAGTYRPIQVPGEMPTYQSHTGSEPGRFASAAAYMPSKATPMAEPPTSTSRGPTTLRGRRHATSTPSVVANSASVTPTAYDG